MNNATRVWMLLTAGIVSTPVLFACPASADPVDASLTLSADVFNGTNQVSGQGRTTQFDALPIPVAEINLRHDRDALRIELVPSIDVNSTGDTQMSGTRLSLLNVAYRRFIGDGYFVGIGDSAFNETTTAPDVAETQSDHMSGVRYEVGHLWRLRAGTVEASVAASPVLNGNIFTTFYAFGTNQPLFTVRDPERSAQVDAYLRASARLSRHLDFMYGVRYLNITGRYVAAPGYLSSRDVGFAPTIGLRLH